MRRALQSFVEDRAAGIATALAAAAAPFLLLQNLGVDRLQQYVHLAGSFLDGRLDLPRGLAAIDEPARFGGRDYLPLGPAPAVLLLPFAAAARGLGFELRQGHLNPALVAAVLALAVRLARRAGLAARDAWLLAFAFVFASAFLAVAALPISNYFAHAVVTVCLLLALLEQLGRCRPLLVGGWLAIALATRLSAGLAAAFFLGSLLLEPVPLRRRLARAAALALPIALAAGALLLYNEARFGDPFETGYRLQRVPDPLQLAARRYGLVSHRYVLANLYYLLLAPPWPVFAPGTLSVLEPPWLRPSPWGMSILATSPWLVYLARIGGAGAAVRGLLATSALVLAALLPTWSMGYAQYGYRFALDFWPLLWLALALGLARRYGTPPAGFKALVLLSALANAWWLAAFLAAHRGGP
jgi:hypothetical protein